MGYIHKQAAGPNPLAVKKKVVKMKSPDKKRRVRKGKRSKEIS